MQNYLFSVKRFIAFIVVFAVLSQNVLAATFTVTENTDAEDSAPGNGVCATAGAVCTLRAAITEANALAGTDTINFSTGNKVINPTAGYTISSQLTIDGSTVGASNTADIDGNDGAFNAFTLNSNSSGTAIKGLYIHDFGVAGITVQAGADSITIGGTNATDRNYIGLAVGEASDGNTGGGLVSAGTNVTIQGNVISGNTGNGISLINGSKDVTIKSNRIGTNSSGTLDRGNTSDGINVSDMSTPIALNGGNGGVEGLVIGSNVTGAGNIIGGNDRNGITIGDDSHGVSGTAVIQGNYIGLNEAGAANANTGDGLHVESDANLLDITVGTDGDGTNDANEANFISGNGGDGMEIEEGGTVNVAGNKVGMSTDDTARGNTANGITIGTIAAGPDTLRIGSDNGDANEMNTVSNNARGVNILNATTINVAGNYIGFNSSGANNHQNTQDGVYVAASQAATVNIGTGGTSAANRNYVGNNVGDGIEIASTSNGATVKVKNNVVGVAADFTTSAGNVGNGIRVAANATTTIGTDLDGSNDSNEANIVSANSGAGIVAENGSASVTIAGNIVGLKGASAIYTTAAGNSGSGIYVGSNSLTSLTIGGSDNNQRNVIGSNGTHGIQVQDAGNAIAYTIRNNYIGFGNDGSTARGNTARGIELSDGGALSIIDNVVGNNVTGGVNMTGGTSLTFTGNKIGAKATGIAAAGNTCYGLNISALAMTDVDIGSSSTTNVFAANTTCSGQTGDGIRISNLSATNTPVDIVGNYIGIGSDGTTTTGMGNAGDGIVIVKGAATIGGDNDLANSNLASGNVISNNTGSGISFTGPFVTAANIYGNIIGLKKDGSSVYNTAAGNTVTGISFGGTTALTTANIGEANGTTTASRRNILADNGVLSLQDVIRVHTSSAITTLKIKNNYIGTNITGATALGNGGEGISIESTVTNLTIGSDLDGTNDANEGNVISNSGTGAAISFISTANVTTASIHGNTLGMNAAKTVAMANYTNGIYVSTANITTLNIGTTNSNSRNYISGNLGAGINLNTAPVTATVNILNNIIGLNGAGTAAVANGNAGINLAATQGSTVNIGDGTSSGRNIISGNSNVGIVADGGTVTILDNYVGVAADGTTSLPNTTYEIASTNTGGSVRSLKIGASGDENKINNNSHVGVNLNDITTWNETNSYLETDNTWTSLSAGLAATYNYWQRYVTATLTAYGPHACYDGANNDGDTYTDYPGDIGCTSVQDNDEYNDLGGGFVYPSTPRSSGSTTTADSGGARTTTDATPTSDDRTADEEAVAETDADVADADTETVAEKAEVVSTETPADTRENVRRYIIREKLSEAVNTTTDTVLDKERVNIDLLLNGDSTNVPASGGGFASAIDILRTSEQELIADVIDTVSGGGTFSKTEEKKVEIAVTAVVGKAVQEVFEKAGGDGGGAIVLFVNKANGKKVQIDKNTKFKFVMDHKKAADEQDLIDVSGENEVILTPSTILGPGRVSTMLQIMEGGDVSDPLAAEKVYFRGVKGISSKVTSLDELKPEKPMITNLSDDMEIAPQAVLYLAGPRVNQKLSLFAVDKIDSEDPNDWKTYEFGDYTIDEAYKAVATVDFSDKMSGDIKKFDIVVQDEDGNGSIQEITVNKAKELKLDSVLLRDGKQVIPADLTHDESDFTKTLHTTVLLAAESAKQADRNPDGDGLMTLSGYSEPGSIVFVTWESMILSSVVIADASQGYFEVEVPQELAKGEHKALTYSYNNKKKVVSNFAKVLFSKYL